MTGNKHYLSTSKILVIHIFKNQSGYLAFWEGGEVGGYYACKQICTS